MSCRIDSSGDLFPPTVFAKSLTKVVNILDSYCQLRYAEKWDNVGLLIEPTNPRPVNRVLITNDSTQSVIDEAILKKASLIISYHPPIFSAIKRLTQDHWKERIVIQCIENKIAVYSPHTALDAKHGGLNDWLLSPFDSCTPIYSISTDDPFIEITAPMNEKLQTFCAKNDLSLQVADSNVCGLKVSKFRCTEDKFQEITDLLSENYISPTNVDTSNKKSILTAGAGRIALLRGSYELEDIIIKYKKLLGVKYLSLALGAGRSLSSVVRCIAVCAGSGGRMLSQQKKAMLADLLVTGEASHHEQLEAVARGASVLMLGHSQSERSYLKNVFTPWLRSQLCIFPDGFNDGSKSTDGEYVDEVIVEMANEDRPPFEVV